MQLEQLINTLIFQTNTTKVGAPNVGIIGGLQRHGFPSHQSLSGDAHNQIAK